jgi:hypothetical protein
MMYSVTTAQPKNNQASSSPSLRLMLYKNEIFHLPQTCWEIRVLSGCAWLTLAGRDIILTQGDQLSLAKNKDFALVSALGQNPLVFEIWNKVA